MNDTTTIASDKVRNLPKKYAVTEIFGPTLQGEGVLTGAVTHFLRFGGCSLQCSWCDSLNSVIPELVKEHADYMTMSEIISAIQLLPTTPWITLTGGDPCIQQGLDVLINHFNAQGIQIAIETQGMHFPDWLVNADIITFSPKGPSSGNIVDPQALIEWLGLHHNSISARICIKIVIGSEEDLDYALDIYKRIPQECYEAFYFNAASHVYDPELLEISNMPAIRQLEVLSSYQLTAQTIITLIEDEGLRFNSKVRVGCQQHVLLWPGFTEGV